MDKIDNAKLNKKLIGDEISLTKIKKPHGDGLRGPRTPKAPKWFEDFVTQKFDPMAQILSNLEETVSTQFKEHG